ncbi:hypothetical protein CLAFUW4_08434 [Fulvia fulva]|nr:hypothetical protein CLAFUW4_08434 [Fulvia fulva]
MFSVVHQDYSDSCALSQILIACLSPWDVLVSPCCILAITAHLCSLYDMSSYYQPSCPNITVPSESAFEPQRPRYDPVTEVSPRIPREQSSEKRTTHRVTRQPSQGSPPTRSLPGLSELFASRLLVAPNPKQDRTASASLSAILNNPSGYKEVSKPSTRPYVPNVGRQSPSRHAATPILSSSVPTTPDSWTSELPPLLQDTQVHGFTRSLQQANPGSPPFHSESFGASVVGGQRAFFTSEQSASRYGHSLPPTHHNEEIPVHRVDSRAGWTESDLRPAVPELLPATYMYRTDCGMISGPQPYADCAVGFSVPGREDLVYPMWDLTKRKLPRKRMSTARTDCRKKKIRCEPGAGGCLQCRKAQKPCVIEPVKRRRRRKALSSDADAEESDNGSEELEKARGS